MQRMDYAFKRWGLPVLALATIALSSSAAHAQGHVHNWTLYQPLPTPVVTVDNPPNDTWVDGQAFPLTEEIIPAGHKPVTLDSDRCVNPGCSFTNGVASNPWQHLTWTDHGAGGTFGYMNGGNFVATGDANLVTHYRTPSTPGNVTISLTIDDIPQVEDPVTHQIITTFDDSQQTDDLVITVWDILSPAGDGTKWNYLFGLAPDGVCGIPLSASIEVAWSAAPIQGATIEWQNDQGPDPDATFQSGGILYRGMPTSNSQFGGKWIRATKSAKVTRTRQRSVKIYFASTGKNHPFSSPYEQQMRNFFYYWRQTIAMPAGPIIYRDDVSYGGLTYYDVDHWQASICRGATGNATVNYWNEPFMARELDLFAWLCRHELYHLVHLGEDWGYGDVIPGFDIDDDYLRDNLEALRNPPPRGGASHPNGYSMLLKVSYPDHFGYGGAGWDDSEDWCLHNQSSWTNGAATSEDWATPGLQW